MTCPQCRFENPQDAQFCTECGASLKTAPKAGTSLCPQCRSENDQDASFCINCGSPLQAEPKRDIRPESVKVIEEPKRRPGPKKKISPEQPQPLICPQCRSANEQDAAFCIECGGSLKLIPAARPTPSVPAPAPLPEPPAKPPIPPVLKKEPPAPIPGAESAEPRPTLKKEAAAGPQPAVLKKTEPSVPAPEPAPPKPKPPVAQKAAEPRKPRKWLLPAGIVAALAVAFLAVWYFALRPKPIVIAGPQAQESPAAESAPQAAPSAAPEDSSQSTPPAETQAQPPAEEESTNQAEENQASAPPQPSAPPPPAKAAAQPTADISEQISLGIEAFQQKDYDQCIKQMKAALSQDPANRTAKRYLADAESLRKESRNSAAWLQAAEEAYQAGDFEQCLEQTKKILALDPDQAQALRYEEMAHQKLAPQRIKSMVDEFTAAVNGGRLLPYYEASCLPALYQKIKRDVELMNGMYGQFKSQSSQTTIRFLDNGLIDARFSNITTGQLKTDNRQIIVFEGAYVWTLQRQGDRWKIAGLQSQPIRKKA